MKYLTQYVKSDITQHAKSELPNECCGIIYESDNEYKSKRCIRDSSHTEDKIGVFSDADKKVSRAHGLPLVMYCVSNEKFLEYI